MALTRSSRPRRASAPAPRPRFGLLAGEPLGVGLRRAALEQADLAIAMLDGDGAHGDERAIHETRKALKRLRAIVRLLRSQLGEKTFARESDALQQIAARLSGARDADVMLATLDALLEGHRRVARRGGVKRLRRRLASERRSARAATVGASRARGDALVELRAFRLRAGAWELGERGHMRLVEDDLRRVYRQGRRRAARLRPRGRSRKRDTALHKWRKRVKDLRYSLEVLQRDGSAIQAKRMRGAAARADELGELLGEDHDLAVLAELVREKRTGTRVGRGSRKALLALIAKRRRKLQRRALRLGERLYRRRPKRFVRRVRAEFEEQLRVS